MFLDPGVNLHEPLVLLADEVLLGQVDEVDDGLRGDELGKFLFDHLHLGGAPLARADRLIVGEHLLNLVHRGDEERRELHRRVLLHVHLLLFHRALEVLHVLRAELMLNGLEVAHGVDAVVHVDHLLAVKRAHHVEDSIHRLDVGQESVAETGALGGAADETGDVGDVEIGGIHGGGLPDVAEVVVAVVRHRASRLVRFDSAEGKVLRGDRLGREEVEEGRLADVGKADDAHLQVVAHAAEARGAHLLLCIFLLLGGHGACGDAGVESAPPRRRSDMSSSRKSSGHILLTGNPPAISVSELATWTNPEPQTLGNVQSLKATLHSGWRTPLARLLAPACPPRWALTSPTSLGA